ncbi:MAG: hypothetical protein H7240_00980 [Glaciimonas sp.]|nr:hypothetical protein [Glaciimonas sp.]
METFEHLQKMTQERLPDVRVVLAFLELMTLQLPEVLAGFVTDGVIDVNIVSPDSCKSSTKPCIRPCIRLWLLADL